jgi:hypothetical protein
MALDPRARFSDLSPEFFVSLEIFLGRFSDVQLEFSRFSGLLLKTQRKHNVKTGTLQIKISGFDQNLLKFDRCTITGLFSFKNWNGNIPIKLALLTSEIMNFWSKKGVFDENDR